MAKPICVHCRKPYGQRAVEPKVVTWGEGEPKPPPGNLMVLKERRFFSGSGSGMVEGVRYGPRRHVAVQVVWDGETYRTPYEPFCTVRCGLAYARKAYRDGLPAAVPGERRR